MVHVHERYTPEHGSHNINTTKPFEYRFYATNPCWTTGFETGLQRAFRTPPVLQLTTLYDNPVIEECSNCCAIHSADHLRTKLPLVSRQFWHEALAAFKPSLTLRFSCARVFYDWSRSEQRLAKQVHSLEIVMTRLSDSLFAYPHWALVLYDENLAAFEKCRGLRLLAQVGTSDTLRLRDDYNVMNSSMWNMTKLSHITRAFQRHRLDQHLTSVALLMPTEPFTPGEYCCPSEYPDRKLSDAVCRALLDHHSSHEFGDE